MNKKQNIIVIEDNVDDFEALEINFKKLDPKLNLTWYSDPQKALDYLKQISLSKDYNIIPKLVILDLNMPGINGFQVTKFIKSTPIISAIPLIIMSTSDTKEDINTCYSMGASTFMQKPIDMRELAENCFIIKEYWSKVAKIL